MKGKPELSRSAQEPPKKEGPRPGGPSVRCKAADVDDNGNPYVEQFIHGSPQGPIQMQVLRP
jgi:hypothetical protein